LGLFAKLNNYRITWIKTTPERRALVVKDVTAGSEPGMRFYLLLSTSALIAAFGLIANSAAVIIGAMLVSPLMTPIIGSALGLVIGDARLFANALRSVVVGTVLAILFSALLGILPLALEATPEMLARTSPTLLDLFVAILAGFAGSYAMIDEKVSPALPGVAIAVAIVPPLSNTGICLSLGYYDGAFGSFMLFFANFLSILLVASATFIAAGLTPQFQLKKDKNFVRSLVIAAVGFLVVAGFLTFSLVDIVKDRHLKESIKDVLSSEFDKLHSTSVDNYVYDVEDGKLFILASVRSPVIMTPKAVKKLEDSFNDKIDMPIELIVRSIISKDVSAFGSANEVLSQNLDGFFLNKNLTPDQKMIRLSEQVILEKLSYWPRMRLMNVELINLPRGPTILATVTGFRLLTDKEIRGLEDSIRETIKDDDINLVVRTVRTYLTDNQGDILYGWQYGLGLGMDDEKKEILKKADQSVKAKFKRYKNVFPVNVHKRFKGEELDILVEAVGAEPLSPAEIASLELELNDELHRPVNLDVWYKTDAVITSEGYQSFETYNERNISELEQVLRDQNEN
jgi:uncharacterized hydrophobic protein (TIGR00271 family)